jgi:kynureninase
VNIIRSSAEKLDRGDPLSAARERFHIVDPELIYLDGNSLGRLPLETRDRISTVLDHQWGERLIRSWGEGWMELPTEIGDRLGAAVLGAQTGETVVCDNVTVNIKKLMYSAHAMRPDRADVIIAGAIIQAEALKRLGAETVLASARGLRYGLLYELLTDA